MMTERTTSWMPRLRRVASAVAFAAVLPTPSAGKTLDEFLVEKETLLREARDKASASHKDRCSASAQSTACDVAACGGTFPESDFRCDSGFGPGGFSSRSRSTVSFPPGASFTSAATRAFLSGSRALESLFAKNLADNKIDATQYVTHTSGATRRLPGSPDNRTSEKCESFDARLRPWYAAAASGPKDIVLVLDTSGSMALSSGFLGESRLAALKRTVLALLETMTPNDFIGIVQFGSDAAFVGGSKLRRATPKAVAALAAAVKALTTTGRTSMSKGIKRGFEMLASSPKTSGCTRVMQFLTDGHSTEPNGEAVALQAAAQGQAALGSNPAHIFTYSMGSGAAKVIEQKLACAHRGVWMPIAKGQDPLQAMGQYFRLLASGIQNTAPRWTNPYADKFGKGQVVTVTLPYYDRSRAKPLLAGVVAIDVTLKELRKYGTQDEIDAALEQRSAACAPLELSECHLQHLRAPTGFTCPNQPAASSCPGGADEFEIAPCPGQGNVNDQLCERIDPKTQLAPSKKQLKTIVAKCSRDSSPGGAAPAVETVAKGMSVGLIILAILSGCIVLVALAVLVAVAVWCYFKHKKPDCPSEPIESPCESYSSVASC